MLTPASRQHISVIKKYLQKQVPDIADAINKEKIKVEIYKNQVRIRPSTGNPPSSLEKTFLDSFLEAQAKNNTAPLKLEQKIYILSATSQITMFIVKQVDVQELENSSSTNNDNDEKQQPAANINNMHAIQACGRHGKSAQQVMREMLARGQQALQQQQQQQQRRQQQPNNNNHNNNNLNHFLGRRSSNPAHRARHGQGGLLVIRQRGAHGQARRALVVRLNTQLAGLLGLGRRHGNQQPSSSAATPNDFPERPKQMKQDDIRWKNLKRFWKYLPKDLKDHAKLCLNVKSSNHQTGNDEKQQPLAAQLAQLGDDTIMLGTKGNDPIMQAHALIPVKVNGESYDLFNVIGWNKRIVNDQLEFRDPLYRNPNNKRDWGPNPITVKSIEIDMAAHDEMIKKAQEILERRQAQSSDTPQFGKS